MGRRSQLALLLVVATLAAASTWFYMDRILIPQQVADAVMHNRPRGNLSDLYPRWLGARELLLHGRNPYSREITLEIQKGYYGRALDALRPDDPTDQQGFAYPAYVVFLLAPTVKLPFEEVQAGFRWLLIGLSAMSVICWFALLRWRPSLPVSVLSVVLVLGSIPVVQGIKLQQLSLLVAGLLAACAACFSRGWLFCAGGLLALATIKPQLAWPLVLWLLLWAMSELRSRWKFVFGFGLGMLLLVVGAEIVLPGWWRMFLDALSLYHRYTNNQSVLVWPLGNVLGHTFEAVALLVCGFCLWPSRHEPVSSVEFGRAFALILALTVLIVPMFAPYNQVLLVPAILMLLRDAPGQKRTPKLTLLVSLLGFLLLIWPWVATLVLTAQSFWLPPAIVQGRWSLPFYSTFALPVFVFGFALMDAWKRRDHRKRGLRADAATA